MGVKKTTTDHVKFGRTIRLGKNPDLDNAVTGQVETGSLRDTGVEPQRWNGTAWERLVGGIEFDRLQQIAISTGILTVDNDDRSNLITRASTTEIDILGGTGVIVDRTDPLDPFVTFVDWDAQTNITVPAGDGAHSVGVDVDGIVFVDTSVDPVFSLEKRRSLIRLGVVIVGTPVGDITPVVSSQSAYGIGTRLQDMLYALGPVNDITESISIEASPTGTGLQLQLNPGQVISSGAGYTFSADVPDVIDQTTTVDPAPVVALALSDNSFTISATAELDPTQFESSSGTLSPVTGNKFTLQRVFVVPLVRFVVAYYGTVEYNSLALAVAADNIQLFSEPGITEASVLVNSLAVENNTTDITDPLDAQFVPGWRVRVKI